MTEMQPSVKLVPNDFANDGNGKASSHSLETQAITVDDASKAESLPKDDGPLTRAEAKPSDGDGTLPPPSVSRVKTSPDEKKDTSEPELLTLSGLRDSMAQMTKHASLRSVVFDSEPVDIGSNIRYSLSCSLGKAAGIIAYVDYLEKTIASLKEGTHKSVNPNKMAVDEDSPKKPMRWKLGVKRLKEVHDRKYGSRKLIEDDETVEDSMANDDTYKKSGGHVIICCRIYNEHRVHTSTNLEIVSTLLLDALNRVIEAPPVDRSVFSEPYMMIFHNRKKLHDEIGRLEGDSKDHLGLLLDFVKGQWPGADQAVDRIENDTIEEIGYNELWLLYPKGTVVYAWEDEEWLAYRVSRCSGFSRRYTGSFSSLSIECEFLQFDGTGCELEVAETSFTILPFTDSQQIQNLRLVPEAFMLKGAETREHLIARGQTYWDFRGKGHFQEYTGNAWLTTTPNDGLRVMIDYVTSSRRPIPDDLDDEGGARPRSSEIEHVTSSRRSSPDYYHADRRAENMKIAGRDSTERLLYCPAKVLAFSLREKIWRSVKISELRDVRFREDSFKKLVIKAKHKTVVKAMVRSYLSKEPIFGDLIQGKGRGLIVLLHGAPGTGKTLTAECVAEKENRPLYMVTCGDLGTEPDVLERKLHETFEFAVNWNAVLLLDEADVFLQERDVHDLKRNALVSIFLRQLEYFDGVLFLTTNRPGSFDDAFQSRIHMALGLPELHAESQMKVWAIFVKDLNIGDEEKKAILKHVGEDIEKNGNLNGRQIRNAVRTAIAIAAQKKEQVSEQHVKDVLGIGRDFKVYLEQVNRMNQEQRAAAIGTRVPVKD